MSDPHDGEMADKSAPDSEDIRDQLIFEQDLNEVYLLIDFVSGRADRSLSALRVTDPDNGEILSTAKILAAIGELRYPPKGVRPKADHRNSAILLQTKDQLSALAQPARGSTIAYTTIFVNLEAAEGLMAFLRPASNRIRRRLGIPIRSPSQGYGGREPRVDLAERVFPGLTEHARKFSVWRHNFARLTLLMVFMTCLVYWDAGHGRAALDRLDQVWKAQLDLASNNPQLLNCPMGTMGNPPPPLKDEPGKSALDRAKTDLDCRRFNYAKWMSEEAGKEVKSIFECENNEYWRVHTWCWRWLMSGYQQPKQDNESDNSSRYGEVSPYVKHNATLWQNATLVLTVFTSFIAPMMFAMVGALIGSLRRITHLIAESALSSRDFVWMQLAVPMGLVAGIAVALFLNPSSLPPQGSGVGGPSSQITLTASGLGFLAGYAAERVFRFLDGIVNTAFPDRSSAATGRAPSSAPQA